MVGCIHLGLSTSQIYFINLSACQGRGLSTIASRSASLGKVLVKDMDILLSEDIYLIVQIRSLYSPSLQICFWLVQPLSSVIMAELARNRFVVKVGKEI